MSLKTQVTDIPKKDIHEILKLGRKPLDDLLVVFDIDGTLTDKNGIFLDAVRVIRKLNCNLAFASGRNLSSLHFFVKDIVGLRKSECILISENGGSYRLPKVMDQTIRFKKSRLKKVVNFLFQGGYAKALPELQHTRVSDHMFNKKDLNLSTKKLNQILNQEFLGKYILTDSGSSHVHLHSSNINKGLTLSKICRIFKNSKI
jgi:hydroxymethylpyrimidine pyrophosphatase-like HAD family hydrolase